MYLDLKYGLKHSEIELPGSKSITNRVLILNALSGGKINILNASQSEDSDILKYLLTSSENVKDVKNCGTAARFLLSFFAVSDNTEIILTGDVRMQKRPIKQLVNALRFLGADISYLNEEGFFPLKIKGKLLKGGKVSINSEVSSQFISSLILVAPFLENGLELILEGTKIVSKPYIDMSLSIFKRLGIDFTFEENTIKIARTELKAQTFYVESDWSSASYFYSLLAVQKRDSLILKNLQDSDLQGDSCIVKIFEKLGITTRFIEKDAVIEYKKEPPIKLIELNLEKTPDIAPTLILTLSALEIPFKISGLSTLNNKESSRIEVISQELKKFGIQTKFSYDSIEFDKKTTCDNKIILNSHNDHRIAMSFACMSFNTPFFIDDSSVVRKSFPDFWNFL